MTQSPDSKAPAHPALALLQQRVSHPRLTDPGPSQAQLADLYRAAMRAPDHAWLRPWRFIEVSGDDRSRLGEQMAHSARQDDPDLADKQYQKLLNSPLRAPLVLIAWAKISEHPKVPAIEQVLATGAAVCAIALSTAPTASFAQDSAPAPEAAAGPADASDWGTFGIQTQWIDKSVDPGDDFYEYVNGEWLETTEIPADKTNYGSFTALADEAETTYARVAVPPREYLAQVNAENLGIASAQRLWDAQIASAGTAAQLEADRDRKSVV